ncbi:MAG: hypothetical protein IPM59_07750 [Chloracidobacterium sp.]|nr:hypothetical protein [Chloracidobacterium sp.]
MSEELVRRSHVKVSAMFKYWRQIVISIPSLSLLVLAILRNVFGFDVSFNGVGWLIGVNLLSFAACVAFAQLRPQNKAWRYAAFFNAWLFILGLIAGIFRFGA